MNWTEFLNQFLNQRRRVFLIGIVLLYAALLSYQITEPFIGDTEQLDGMNGISAANWLYFGPVNLKFAQLTVEGGTKYVQGIQSFYLNHPNFLIAPLALSYKIFGIGEWQTRLVPILFSILSLIVFWFLIERLFRTPWLTALSSLLYALFPTSIYYGRLMTHEPIVVFFILSLYLALVLFEQEQKKKYLVGVCAATLLGALTDWPFFFAAGAALGYVALKKDYPKRKLVLLCIAVSSAVAVGITAIQIWTITTLSPITFWRDLYLNKQVKTLSPFIFLIFLFWRLAFDARGFTDIGIIIAVIGLVVYFRDRFKNAAQAAPLMLLAIPGLFTYIFFYPTVTAHAMSGLYFVPFMGLLSAWGIGHIKRRWILGTTFAIFVGSSFFYTSSLFSYAWFAPDDFVLAKRVNTLVPKEKAICAEADRNLIFYLLPRQIDKPPCPNDNYLLLQRPEGLLRRNPSPPILQKLLASDFRQNTAAVSFSVATGMEIAKRITPIKRALDGAHRDENSLYFYASFASRVQKFIESRNLKPIECSTNFCLYQPKQTKQLKTAN